MQAAAPRIQRLDRPDVANRSASPLGNVAVDPSLDKRCPARFSPVIGRWLLSLLVFCALWLPRGAQAATFDPDLTWRTLQTDHFKVHFHQGEEELAESFSTLVEEAWNELTPEVGWRPRRRIEVVLIDRTDSANGYASTTPYNRIVIYVTAPQEDSTLGFYEDWSTTVFRHELTHILHLDTNHELVRLARWVVGRIASTNNVSPGWMVEGFATFEETRMTPGGRGRAPQAHMIKRTAVVEDAWPALDVLDGYQPDPPAGNLRYLFGQDFLQYISDTRGRDAFTKFLHSYGSGIPFFLPGKKVFGTPLGKLYQEWKEARAQEYGAQLAAVEAEGLREGRLVSAGGTSSCRAPAFSPDGTKLIWSCYDRATGSSIWMADGAAQAPEKLLQDRGGKYFTWRGDSKAFAYASLHTVNRFNTFNDVYLHTLGSKGARALTTGARARDPEFSPDGSRLVVVTNKVQNNQLEVLTVDKQRRALTENTDHTQYSTPRFSPDGRVMAVSVWQDGRRDLWLASPEGELLRRLTQDRWVDTDPWWTADGRYLFFASDRSGIPNVYAIDVQTERLWQVTNVRTGANMPSVHPDGHLLAYQQYSQDGSDVMLLELDPDTWLDRGLLPQPPTHGTPIRELTGGPRVALSAVATDWDGREERWQPPGPTVSLDPVVAQNQTETVDSFDMPEGVELFGDEDRDFDFSIPPHRYNPLPGLLPRYWLPVFATTPYQAQGPIPIPFQAQAISSAFDPLSRFGWSASLNYRNDADFVGWGASLTINRWIPIYTLSATAQAVGLGAIYPENTEDPDTPTSSGLQYWERRHTFQAAVSYPYTPRTTVFGRYTLMLRTPLDELPDGTDLSAMPTRGSVGRLSAGFRYAWSQQTPYSVSTEDGRIFNFIGSVIAPWLGTFILDENDEAQPLTQLQLTTELREYWVNPWVPNHVLAVQAGLGLTLGPEGKLTNYALGGSIGDSAFVTAPDEFRMLRGYGNATDLGDMYYLASAEYRFPIARFYRGIGLLPLKFQQLSGAVFVDAGNAFSSFEDPAIMAADTRVGVGAELRLSMIVAWGVGAYFRAGYAVGLTNDGYAPTDLRTFYLQFGPSF